MSPRRPSRTPTAVIVIALVAIVLFVLPLVGLLVRTPWADLPDLLSDEIVADALRISVISSIVATVISLVLGVPLALLLARVEFPGRSVVRGLVTLPLVLPPVVGGAALLFAFGRRGTFGGPLYDATGLVLPFSTWGVIVATTFVAMPFMVITVEGALRATDVRYEAVAATLGARPWTVLRRVTLPAVAPGLIAGTLLTWARAFGEFGATVTFAGSLQGTTQTLPLAVFVGLESNRDVAIAISLLMVVVSLAVLVVLRDRWWGVR